MNKKSQSQFGKVVFGHFFCPILKSQIYFWGKNKQNMHIHHNGLKNDISLKILLLTKKCIFK
jgi:hypothetical protein